MLTREEITWLKGSANELNNLLQEISASASRIESLTASVPGIRQYLAITVQRVERASKVTSSMLQRARSAEFAESPVTAGPSTKSGYGRFRVIAGKTGEPAAGSESGTPAAQSASPMEVAKEFGLTVANPGGAKELVLMVDDEEAVLLLAKMMLTDAGYRVITVPDPVQGLRLFEKLHAHIGLVILDFAMPVMDGGELFDEMRAIDPGVTAVLSSGFADQNKLSRMLSQGLKGFIPKPYTPDKLLLQIRSVLDIGKKSAPGR